MNGYEIHVTEFYYAGLFERASVLETIALFTAIVYEPRKMDDTDPVRIPLEKEAIKLVRDWRRAERRAELAELLKRPDFGLNAVVLAWAKGAAFEDLRRFTSVSEGDLVRTLRMSLQLMRQLRRVLQPDDPLAPKLVEAAGLMDRDVVDARRQLELG